MSLIRNKMTGANRKWIEIIFFWFPFIPSWEALSRTKSDEKKKDNGKKLQFIPLWKGDWAKIRVRNGKEKANLRGSSKDDDV